jgi:Tfp pilus assembly protein PilN
VSFDRINLFPPELQESKQLPRETMGAIAFAIATVLFASLAGLKYRSLGRTEIVYNQTMTTLREIRQKVQEAKVAKDKDTGSKSLELVRDYLQGKYKWSQLLKELSLITPNSVWLSALTGKFDDGQFTILLTAEATSQKNMSDYFSRLERSYYFRDVKFKYSEQLKEVRPAAYRFQLECLVSPEGLELFK